MGVSIVRSDKDALDFNHATWGALLELAYEHGWRPAGTNAPSMVNEDGTPWEHGYCDPDKWDGSYTSNDFQTVGDDDAKAFGEALMRAIAEDRKKPHLVPADVPEDYDGPPPGSISIGPNDSFDDFCAKIAEAKERAKDYPLGPLVKEVAEFALRGGFIIM
jgi:hypothetical protein